MQQYWQRHWPHAKAVLVLGTPLIGGHLAQHAIGLTDIILLGWYGVEALAAVVLGQTLFMALFLFGCGFAWAVLPMVSASAADGDVVISRRITRMGLWASFVFAFCCMPLFIMAESIFLKLGQGADVAADAATYLRIAGFGIFPALGVMVIKSFLAALEDTRAVFWITVAAAVVNAGVNWVLIFGKLGFPEMGLVGAAIASLITQLMSFVLAVAYAARRYPDYQLFRRFWVAESAMLMRLVRIGTPIGLTTLAEVGLFTVATFLMGLLGTLPLAAHGIALNVTTVFFMVQIGLSNAATIRAGQSLARKSEEALFDGARAAILLAFVFAIFASLCMVLFPGPLMGLFLDPNEPQREAILQLGAALLALAALFQIVDGQQVVVLGVLRGLQDTKIPMIIATISYWIVGLTASLGLGFGLGLGAIGIWIGLVLGLAAAAILLHWRFWMQGASLLRLDLKNAR